MDPRVRVVLAPLVAMGVSQAAVGRDDELPGELPWIVHQGAVRAMAGRRQAERL